MHSHLSACVILEHLLRIREAGAQSKDPYSHSTSCVSKFLDILWARNLTKERYPNSVTAI